MSTKFIALFAAVAAVLISLSAAADELSLKGTWTGHRERIAEQEGYRNGTATLVVAEQKGLTFKGTMHWSTPAGDMHDDLAGAFTPGGKLIMGSDAEGTYIFNLLDNNTLDYCYSEHGENFKTTCARLIRQP